MVLPRLTNPIQTAPTELGRKLERTQRIIDIVDYLGEQIRKEHEKASVTGKPNVAEMVAKWAGVSRQSINYWRRFLKCRGQKIYDKRLKNGTPVELNRAVCLIEKFKRENR